ncbi:trimeric intracellular cation channel family protein [Longispora albida]|uniref:trimeric intracellular cation channel family protein n=1 Tax=Longispora albida TaxID=203523 RepID=UPI00037A09DD|nr:TRIC cation channel family protein [Longispora albida]
MDSAAGLLLLDLIGVAVFAASGASAGVAKRLDLFGVAMIGMVAALGGGMIRDLVINQVPPLAFADWRYVAVAVAVSISMFWLHPAVRRLRRTVLVLDAAGLGLFTVTGTLKALDAGVPAVGAILLGTITGIGGGLLRDVLTGEIPVVLRREVYALASLVGAAAVAVIEWQLPKAPVLTVLAAVLVFALRLGFLKSSWQVPVAEEREYRPLRRRRGNSAPGGRTD